MRKKYLLQIGVAFVFLYAGISAITNPQAWIGFVPSWISLLHISPDFFLKSHAIFEIAMAVLLLINRTAKYVAILGAIDVLAIVMVNGFDPGVFSTTFRDVGIFFTLLYLVVAE